LPTLTCCASRSILAVDDTYRNPGICGHAGLFTDFSVAALRHLSRLSVTRIKKLLTNSTIVSMKRDCFRRLTPVRGRAGAFGVLVKITLWNVVVSEHRNTYDSSRHLWRPSVAVNVTSDCLRAGASVVVVAGRAGTMNVLSRRFCDAS